MPFNSIIEDKTVLVKYVKSTVFAILATQGFELKYQPNSGNIRFKGTFFFELNRSMMKSLILRPIPKTINDVRLLFTVVT